MLSALELEDFAIIDSLRIDLAPGLNVLTGETGAGKSILVDALGLLTGERADTTMVRTGRPRALVQGFFADAPIETASRRIVAAGRSSARLDGEIVTVADLAEQGGRLIAIHGQHASQTLLEPSEQRELLDRRLPGTAQDALRRYREAWSEFQRVDRDLARLRDASRERARRLDIVRFQIDEIDAAALEPDEDARLQEEAGSLRHSERIVQGAGAALGALSEQEGSALELLAEGRRQLETAGRYHPQPARLAHELHEALTSVQAIADEVESFLADTDLDPTRLEAVEARIALLEGLKRKYGDSVDAILAYRDRVAGEHDALANADADLSALSERRAELANELDGLAAVVSEARRGAAERLGPAVAEQLSRLAMPNARFEVAFDDDADPGPHGRDRLRFLFSANLGEPPAPLAAVASGGELSRLMLTLNVVTGATTPTLVFDEVDAGIGGATARAVGELLRTLARRHQVLVVTHLAQVAAFADAQFYVEKLERDGRTVTRARRLEPTEREAELARMLSGAVTDASLSNARELIAQAGT